MSVYEICQICGWSLTFIVGAVTSIIGFVKAAKNKKKATTAEEENVANQMMLDEANQLIEEAETFFKSLDTVLKKTEGTTAGEYKKENVMTKLQAFAATKGITFDAEYWSTKIDEIVAMTKKVNSK